MDITEFSDTVLEAATGLGIMKLPHGKIAIQVVTEFLREVYVNICRELEKHLAMLHSPLRLRDVQMEFWVTTPAVWSDQTQLKYKEAAIRAGFGPSDDRLGDYHLHALRARSRRTCHFQDNATIWTRNADQGAPSNIQRERTLANPDRLAG